MKFSSKQQQWYIQSNTFFLGRSDRIKINHPDRSSAPKNLVLLYSNAFVPVVGSGENGDAFSIVCDLVPILLHFMTPDDVVQIVLLEKTFRHVRSKLYPYAALARRPADLGLRIRPE